MVERIKKLYLDGRIDEKGVRKAVIDNLITAAEASMILSSK